MRSDSPRPLSNVQNVSGQPRLSLQRYFDIRVGEGTRIAERELEGLAPRWREVGLYGRPSFGETLSGDHGGYRRLEDGLVVAPCDGRGHGIAAREASTAALRMFDEHESEPPAHVIEAAHVAMRDTRGAMIAIARLPMERPMLDVTAVGNIGLQICSPRRARRLRRSSALFHTAADHRPHPVGS